LSSARNTTLFGIAWLALLGPDLESAGGVAVTRQQPVLETRVFDAEAPPAEMPLLGDRERAVTHSEYGIAAEVRVLVVGDYPELDLVGSVVEVESLAIDLGLVVTEWVPDDAPLALVEHEEGHRRISELFYEDAEAIARRLAARYVGRSFRGRGVDVDEARRAAMNEVIRELNRDYLRATHVAAARANELFDDITDHGRRDVAIDEAIAAAVAGYQREMQLAGGPGRSPRVARQPTVAAGH
jgi:hypothetical protein